MNPDKDRCLGNIYSLAKKKGLRIGDLETSCGVSVGYLARLRQDKKQILPGSEFLFRAAVLLETTVDHLLNYDDRFATDTEKYLSSFIRKMIRDTLAEKLIWRKDPSCIPSPYILDKPGVCPDHPLLSLDHVLTSEGKSKEIYLSHFHPSARDLVPLSAWRAAISQDNDVVLVQVTRNNGETESTEPWVELELYLDAKKTNEFSSLCNTNANSPGFYDQALNDLYDSIVISFHAGPLGPSVQDAIDRYMNSRTDCE